MRIIVLVKYQLIQKHILANNYLEYINKHSILSFIYSNSLYVRKNCESVVEHFYLSGSLMVLVA